MTLADEKRKGNADTAWLRGDGTHITKKEGGRLGGLLIAMVMVDPSLFVPHGPLTWLRSMMKDDELADAWFRTIGSVHEWKGNKRVADDKVRAYWKGKSNPCSELSLDEGTL